MYTYLQVQAGDELYFVNVGTKRYLVCKLMQIHLINQIISKLEYTENILNVSIAIIMPIFHLINAYTYNLLVCRM